MWGLDQRLPAAQNPLANRAHCWSGGGQGWRLGGGGWLSRARQFDGVHPASSDHSLTRAVFSDSLMGLQAAGSLYHQPEDTHRSAHLRSARSPACLAGSMSPATSSFQVLHNPRRYVCRAAGLSHPRRSHALHRASI